MLFRTVSSALIISICALISACDESNDSRVVLGTGDKIFELGVLQYQTPFVVQVTDPESNPAPGVVVNFKLRPVGYFKGDYIAADTTLDGAPDQWVPLMSAPECPTEDSNGNGKLDAGEDVNGNGILDPANAATITAHPDELPTITPATASLVTDDNGFGFLAVTYPKSEASWVRMRMTATVQDGLPGNVVTHTFVLQVLLKDVQDLSVAPPGGGASPYGRGSSCADPT